MARWRAVKVFVVLLIGVLVLFGGVRVYAWTWTHRPFEVESEDGSKVFAFVPTNMHTPIQVGTTVRMGVYYNTEPRKLAYRVNLAVADMPLGERNLVFSECFRYMAYIPAWAWENTTAIEFYRDGILLKEYRVNDLIRYPDALTIGWLPPGVWWEDWERRSFNIETNQLSITTFDGAFPFTSRPVGGRTFVFDITTGEIVARSTNTTLPILGVLVAIIAFASHRSHKKRKALQNLSEQPNLAK